MQRIGQIIASFLILSVLVGIAYLGITAGTNLQTSVLLPAVEGTFSFQVEHPVSLRAGEANELTILVQEVSGKEIRTGYIDVTHEPGTEIGEVRKASNIEIVHVDRNPNFTRIFLASSEKTPSPQLRAVAKVDIGINQVPVGDEVIIGLEAMFGGTQVPVILNELSETIVQVPVVYDATKLEAEDGTIVAKHTFISSEAEVGQIVEGNLTLTLPLQARKVEVTLRYPEYLNVDNIIVNNEWVPTETKVDEEANSITLKAFTETELTSGDVKIATIEYETLKAVETGVGIETLSVFASEDSLLDLYADQDLEEVNDHEENILVKQVPDETMIAMEEGSMEKEDGVMEEKDVMEEPEEKMEEKMEEKAPVTHDGQIATLLETTKLLVPLVWDEGAVERNAGKARISPYIRAANMLGIIKIDKDAVADAPLSRGVVLVMADKAASYLFVEAELTDDSRDNILAVLKRSIAITEGDQDAIAPLSEVKELVDALWEELLQ